MAENQPDQETPPAGPEEDKKPAEGQPELKFGQFSYRGPLGVIGALIFGIMVGGVLISMAVFANKPAVFVGMIAENALSTSIAKTPTPTPVSPETVEVVQTVEVTREVEVIKEVEITREVEVVETVPVEVTRLVEVIVTKIVQVTPTPPTAPEVLKDRITKRAFKEAGEYLEMNDSDKLSSLWTGAARENISRTVDLLRGTFGGITDVEWVVDEIDVIDKEEPLEVYTLKVGTTLTLTGSFGCGGERFTDTVSISYPGLMRAEIQDLDFGIVRIYSWTNTSTSSIATELCAAINP